LSTNQLKPLPSDYQELIAAFKQHIAQAERHAADFERRHYNKVREEAVVYCLPHALDLAKGSLAAAEKKLPDSLTTLSRALLETLFWIRYATLSEENAQEFADSYIHELKRTARKNLAAGYAHVTDINTQQDRSGEILNSEMMKAIPKRVSIVDAAKAGGLERVYTNVYGFVSMIAHGRAFGLRRGPEVTDELYASISAALGTLECIEVIAYDWIAHRKQTPQETLMRLLGV